MKTSKSNFKIFVDGKLSKTVPTKEDAMWYLGAKFGGNTYNKMVNENLIIYYENGVSVYVVE